MTRINPGSLKCVILHSDEDRAVVTRDLIERIGADDVREFGAAILLHTGEAAETVRDWMGVAGSALVVEFETWSGSGEDVPREWLLARGH